MIPSPWKPALLCASVAACLALAACGGKTEDAGATAGAPAAGKAGPVPVTPTKPVTLAELPAPYNEANLDNGALIFVKCRNCHTANPKDGNKTGPNLQGVFARHPGTQVGFKYSDAMGHNPHDKWTPEELDKWLTKPKDYLPGSSMFFNGIDNPNDRRDVIAYLMIESNKQP